MWLQLILILVSLIFVIKALSGRGTHSINAWKKIGVLLLGFSMIIAVLLPELTTEVANILGIGRGADLLLYVLFAAFLFYVLNQYLEDQDTRDKMYRLARQVALAEAKSRYSDKF